MKMLIAYAALCLLSILLLLLACAEMQPMQPAAALLMLSSWTAGVSYNAFFGALRRRSEHREDAERLVRFRSVGTFMRTTRENGDVTFSVKDGAREVRKDDLRPDVAAAFDKGFLTDEQMQHLISKDRSRSR